MIESLTNCPNCGGALNESGRCRFCGSKVYDFLTIDFNSREMPSAKTYVRLKYGDKIYIAPVMINTMSMDMDCDVIDLSAYGDRYVHRPCYPKYHIDFNVIGDMILIDKGDTD